MTADTILYACNTVAVGLFGIVLSAAFCNIRWTRRNVCCMVASTLAIFLIQGIVYLGIDPALGPYLYPLHTHLPLAITLCLLSHERLWPVISVLTAYLCCQLRRWLALVCVWVFSGGDRMQYAVELIVTLPLLLLLLRPRHWDKFTVLCGRKVKTAMSPSISACSATVTMTNWLNRQPIWFPIPIILTWVR